MHATTRLAATAIALAISAFAAATAEAATIADWTFENTQPSGAGPFSPEVGAGSASGFHAASTTWSSPAGNGSSHSFSSNGWSVGDYYQFTVDTAGLGNIDLSWDQASSSTGPKDFELEYSTNGTTFTNVASYSVQLNGSPNTPWTASNYNSLYTFNENLTSLTGLNDQASDTFRLVDADTTSTGGGTVASTGTDRVDNFTVSTVPLPAAVWLLGSGFVGLMGIGRRRNGSQADAA